MYDVCGATQAPLPPPTGIEVSPWTPTAHVLTRCFTIRTCPSRWAAVHIGTSPLIKTSPPSDNLVTGKHTGTQAMIPSFIDDNRSQMFDAFTVIASMCGGQYHDADPLLLKRWSNSEHGSDNNCD